MTTKNYHFYTAGSIPDLPGIFAGVVVEVDEQHNEIIAVTPLGQAVAEPTPVPTEITDIPTEAPNIPENKE